MVVSRTLALGLCALALVGCSKATPAESQDQTLTDAMVAKFPACAGHTTTGTEPAVSCTSGGHQYLLYLTPPGGANAIAASLRATYPMGTVTIDDLRVWVDVPG
ncbi:MAG TPA: hypothetical protein VIJ41_02520 [Candidatus Nanopelagicales bacterium]